MANASLKSKNTSTMNQSSETPPDPKAIALISNITQLMDEVEEILHVSENQQEETITETSLSANGDAPANATTFFSRAGGTIVAGARHTEKIIHANPYRSLAISLGTGAFLGLMFARRHRTPA